MDYKKTYNVYFSGLGLGIHRMHFDIDEQFFKMFEYEEKFDQPRFNLDLKLEKNTDSLVLDFDLRGSLRLNCDLSLEPFAHPLEANWRLWVKFASELREEDEEGMLILPFKAHKLNIAQAIYEAVLLALPKKRIHPEVEKGTMSSETLQILSQYMPAEEGEEPSILTASQEYFLRKP